ncbi:putative membrane protein involved in D-alanine export [Lachnospiraceae bacterium JC7]|nr:putative membrane protein involved in D-alanine export [Lachnospiraceae bacterium JC7]
MVFSSTLFLFCFLPVTLAGCYICMVLDKKVIGNRRELSNIWLLIMSILFFAWSQMGYLWIIVLNILVNYVGAGIIHLKKEKGCYTASKILLTLTVAVNLGILFYFKYFDFSIDTVNHVFGRQIPLRNIILPIGISFFTFQAMSYTIDVYRGRAAVQRNPLKLALYVMLFPQLIAGPIVRYTDVETEIDDRRVSLEDFSYGARRFITGLGKKALIANTMAVTVDGIFAQGTENNTVAIAWLGAVAYALQIYFDFSGYSDMAIGLGRMFGFHFLENFDLPYISRSITEFWRRWHISLSTWFRDYVYIPLGGNRCGTLVTYRNLFIIFLLTGIWHGAAWHYIFWGIWHGMFMLMERFFRKRNFVISSIWNVLGHVYTLFVVLMGWIFFRADTLPQAFWYIKTMFGRALGSEPGFSVMWYLDGWTAAMLIFGIMFSTGLPSKAAGFIRAKCEAASKMQVYEASRDILLLALLLLSSMRIVSGTYNPFIYFQF